MYDEKFQKAREIYEKINKRYTELKPSTSGRPL